MILIRALVVALAVLALGANAAQAATALYPDMRTLPPRDLRFDVTDTDQGRQTVLRFTNTVWNAGQGPLAVGATVPSGATSVPATQTVRNDDGTSTSYTVGTYTIHVQHQHFHYDGWGRYELWTKAAYDQWLAAGRPSTMRPDIIGTKTTSCVLDEEFIASLPGTPYPRVYPDAGCDPTTGGKIASGLSVGWGDTYDHYRYDQWIPLGASKLADGDYVLRSVADPENKVYESAGKGDASREGAAANEGAVAVRVANGQIIDLDRPTGTVTVNDVDAKTVSTNVTVRVLGRDDVGGVSQVRVSNDGVTWRQYAYGGSGSVPMTIAWDLADARYGGSTQGGPRTVYAQFQDATGKWSASETDTIELTTGTGGGSGSNSLYATAVLGDGPVSWWRLGELTGTVAADERGLHQGTYVNGPALGQPSLLNSDVNRATRFAGTQHVSTRVSSALVFGSAFSLEAWIKPDQIPSTGGWASIVTRPEAYSLQFNGPRLEFTVIQSGVRKRLQAPAGAVVAGQAYHVLGTFDGKEQRLYLNGQLVASIALTGAASAGWDGLYMASWDGTMEYFRGTLDEVAVYNKMLTGLQAKQHYDAGISTAVGVATPGNLTATAASGSQIDLRWTDNSSNETGWVLERSTSSSFTSPTRIAIDTPDATTWSDKGLAAGTTYHYRLQAVTATDSSAWSNTASAATNVEAVAAPSGLGAAPASSSRIDLRWTDNASNETGFLIERSTNATFTAPATIQVAANTTTYADTNRSAATTYWYRVRAVSDNAASAWSNTASATTLSAAPPAPAGYAAAVAEDGPISHWRLGEASGTTAADARNVNNGTYLNSPTLGAASLLRGDTTNPAVRFNGTSQSARVPDSASLDVTSAFTLEAWIKPEVLPATGGWASVLTKPEAYSLQFNGPRLEFTLIRSGTRNRLQAPSGAVVAGQTYHVVATYDGATQRLYLNGAQVASRAQTGGASVTTSPLSIATWSGGGEWLRGTVDDASIYGKALSATRVQAHWSIGSTAPSTTTLSATRESGTGGGDTQPAAAATGDAAAPAATGDAAQGAAAPAETGRRAGRGRRLDTTCAKAKRSKPKRRATGRTAKAAAKRTTRGCRTAKQRTTRRSSRR